MPIVAVILTVLATTVQGAFKKCINSKCKNCEFTVSATITLFALLFFLVFSNGVTFSPQLLPYCLLFSACYAGAAATYVLALSCGSLALTQLVLSYSCIIPLAYSLLCGEALGGFQILGIAFLLSSPLVTCLKKSEAAEERRSSLKWAVYVLLMFLTNGFYGVFMRMQQLAFSGMHDASFMIFSLIPATAILFLLAFLRERTHMREALKRGALLSAACGASNGIANYFGLICLALIPNSVYYPVTNAGGLVLTGVMSVLIFKERLTVRQYIGMGLGVLALIFINIS